MLYACLLLYVTLIYVRPAEIVPTWAAIPFVDILTAIAAVIGVFSLAAKPRPVANLPQDKLLLAFWAIIAISSVKVWLWACLHVVHGVHAGRRVLFPDSRRRHLPGATDAA